MMEFMDLVKETLDENNNVSITENGAVGFKTTGTALVDATFKVSSMRGYEEDKILSIWKKVFTEDEITALRWLFYAADVRGGMGERRLFRIILKHLATSLPKLLTKDFLTLVPFYTRWDNLWCLLKTDLKDTVCALVKEQLQVDMQTIQENKTSQKKQSISLLGKWMPSINASSSETRWYARIILNYLGMSDRVYQKMLARLRTELNIVEKLISQNQWEQVEYSAVPSKANLKYNNAFLRHDTERRQAFLSSLEKGETKINASVLFPHEILQKYVEMMDKHYYRDRDQYKKDVAIEELWKALPDYIQGNGNTLCVLDTSASMGGRIPGSTNLKAETVARALSIYFAEHCTGQFKNKIITFSESPKFIDLSGCTSLFEKNNTLERFNIVENTNIEAVFDLILMTALRSRMTQDQMPANILILSDMEFDNCVTVNKKFDPNYSRYGRFGIVHPSPALFQVIQQKYESAGYKLPRLVFWNINMRSDTIPVKENDLGVALVSGFSTTVCKMVLSGKTSPYEVILEQLYTNRYDPVEKLARESGAIEPIEVMKREYFSTPSTNKKDVADYDTKIMEALNI